MLLYTHTHTHLFLSGLITQVFILNLTLKNSNKSEIYINSILFIFFTICREPCKYLFVFIFDYL